MTAVFIFISQTWLEALLPLFLFFPLRKGADTGTQLPQRSLNLLPSLCVSMCLHLRETRRQIPLGAPSLLLKDEVWLWFQGQTWPIPITAVLANLRGPMGTGNGGSLPAVPLPGISVGTLRFLRPWRPCLGPKCQEFSSSYPLAMTSLRG